MFYLEFLERHTSLEDLCASFKKVHNRSIRTDLSACVALSLSLRETAETLTSARARGGSTE